jgi:hypothetical protein
MIEKRAPLGIKLLSAFFAVGAAICFLTIVMLLFPGGAPESIWRLNPEAHVAFQKLGKLSVLLMLILGVACGAAAIGLAKRTRWGIPLALAILTIQSRGRFAKRFPAARSTNPGRAADWRGDGRLFADRADGRSRGD